MSHEERLPQKMEAARQQVAQDLEAVRDEEVQVDESRSRADATKTRFTNNVIIPAMTKAAKEFPGSLSEELPRDGDPDHQPGTSYGVTIDFGPEERRGTLLVFASIRGDVVTLTIRALYRQMVVHEDFKSFDEDTFDEHADVAKEWIEAQLEDAAPKLLIKSQYSPSVVKYNTDPA